MAKETRRLYVPVYVESFDGDFTWSVPMDVGPEELEMLRDCWRRGILPREHEGLRHFCWLAENYVFYSNSMYEDYWFERIDEVSFTVGLPEKLVKEFAEGEPAPASPPDGG